MNKLLIQIILSILLFSSIVGQQEEKSLTITGDSLKGKIISGETIREVIGNVIISQENVRITCNKAIQFIAKNEAILIGNVILTQDSVTIRTHKGRYLGNPQISFADSNIHLNNGKLNLYADKGQYDLNTKIAKFFGNVKFNDSLTTLTSNILIYNKNEESITAIGTVNVFDSASTILADSLIHYRNTQLTNGYGNIRIINPENNLTIFGDELFDDKTNNQSKIFGNPFLTQIEELSDGTFDTLYIEAKKMEAQKDSSSKLVAIDSVKIIRGNFSSVNDFTIYDRPLQKITILKQENKSTPVLWYENSQITGDSIFINLDSNKIDFVDIFNNAILISQDSVYEFRFNQMSGDSIRLDFLNGKLNQTNVNGNVLSIYYLFEEEEPNGLLKSSAKKVVIIIENNKVSTVNMYGSPISEYHPENLVKGNEKAFTLPIFKVYTNKPEKNIFRAKFLKQMLK